MCQQGTPPKYPPQPVAQCNYYAAKNDACGKKQENAKDIEDGLE
jgi:hypothetical protein